MSQDHAGPNRKIANFIPRKYNYWTNTVFQSVHYYNGNSFRLSPYQHQGPISASNLLGIAFGVCNRLGTLEEGESSGIGENASSRNGNLLISAPHGFIEGGY